MGALKIDHYSVRYRQEWALLNLVFSIDKNIEEMGHNMFKREASEYQEVRVMESPEDWEEFIMGLEIVWGSEPNEQGYYAMDILRHGPKEPTIMYTNEDSLLRYLPKFDKFVFTEYVELNALTLAALNMLSDTAKFENSTTGYDQLLRILKALDLFWH